MHAACMAVKLLLLLLLLPVTVALPLAAVGGREPRSFIVEGDAFVKNGERVQIVAGELHYFRVPRALWRDRMERIKAMGFNAVQTYVAWNVHEPVQGQVDFAGDKDIESFLQLSCDLDLMVILRPGPYICAEWEFGGLPAWLLANPHLKLRTFEPAYIAAVSAWWTLLLRKMRKHLFQAGGCIVAVQIENEFGQYGDALNNPDDERYLRHLVHLARTMLGDSVVLFTTDFGNLENMQRGSLNGSEVLTAGDFGPSGNYSLSLAGQRAMNPPGRSPPFCVEFYSGWYTAWGYGNVTQTPTLLAVQTLEAMLSSGWSVSVYMAHGGTNFGYMSGANIMEHHDEESGYVPLITSYDYSSPITEAGDHGFGSDQQDKFEAMRALLWSHRSASARRTASLLSGLRECGAPQWLTSILTWTVSAPPTFAEPFPRPKIAYGRVHLKWRAGLWENLESIATRTVEASVPLPFEFVGAAYGYVMYSFDLSVADRDENKAGDDDKDSDDVHISRDFGRAKMLNLTVERVHDRAHIFIDHHFVGVVQRGRNGRNFVELPVECIKAARQLDVLVENLGRVNFGPHFADRKGIVGNVMIGDRVLIGGWRMRPLSLEDFLRATARDDGWPGTGGGGLSKRFDHPSKYNPAQGAKDAQAEPVFVRGAFKIEAGDVADTFLSTRDLGKGYAFVNGFNLGMFWPSEGPQKELFVPASVLHEGTNDVAVFDTDLDPASVAGASVTFLAVPG